MSWKGAAFGAGLGFVLGHSSWLSALFCAVLGHDLEERWKRQKATRRGASARAGGQACSDGPTAPRDTLAEAYATLGVSEGASDEDVRRAYRELAKKCHPDALRAQGFPDETVGRATERMKAVNAAWGAIKAARGL